MGYLTNVLLGVTNGQEAASAPPVGTLADTLSVAHEPGIVRGEAKHLRIPAPVECWDEAIPLGNGTIGGLLYGQGNELRLSLDRDDLWDERPCPLVQREDFTWANWVALKEAGRWEELNALFDAAYQHPTPTKIPCGRMEVTLTPSCTVSAFSLDLAAAVGRVETACGDRAAIECFISATRDVVLMLLPKEERVTWRLVAPAVLQESLGYTHPEERDDGDERWLVQSSPEGLTYAVVASQRRTDMGVLVALTITSTTTDGPDPLGAGLGRVRLALETGYAAEKAAHTDWWASYWSTSDLFVPDELQLRHYNIARYLLGAGSRLGTAPLPLQGVWTADGGLPPWKGDYHHDLNTQMTYLSYLAAGHFDEGRCFLEFMWERLPAFRRFARDFHGTPGAVFPSVMSAAGTALCGWPAFALMPQGNCSWVGWMFYRHWLYTQDSAFLEERAYPFCSELGECLFALLQPDAHGMLKMPISSSPEIGDNTPQAYLPPNSNYDRDGMTALFSALGHMARALARPDEEADRWEQLATRLGPRWSDPVSGELGFASGLPYNLSHRHFSHLMSIHPYGQLSIDGPDQDRRTIGASLAALRRHGADAWCGYSHGWAACLAARAGDGAAALAHLTVYCRDFTSRNGFHLNCNQRGGPGWGGTARLFTLEGNFVAMEAVHEMLLQSWGGVVRLFPAVPAGWRDISFRDMRAEGGFRVSARFRDGAVSWFRIAAGSDGLLCLRDTFGGRDVTWTGPQMRKSGVDYSIRMHRGDCVEAVLEHSRR